jgi:riboflavin biosynthesis pyrimidine reductase
MAPAAQLRRVDADAVRALLEHGRLETRGPQDDRPVVVLNMVATVDGRTTSGGRVRDLTSPSDQLLLRHLRAQADAVLVGANTVRQEGYGTLRSDPVPEADGTDGTRAGARQPLLCIVSGRLALSADLPALQNPDMRVLIITASPERIPDTAAQVEYLRLPGDAPLSIRSALRKLRAERSIERVVCEGGPTLNARLFAEGCVDELFLALCPRVSGDETALTLLTGSLPSQLALALRSHVAVDDYVFLRYEVA